jgi:hypothetical protein
MRVVPGVYNALAYVQNPNPTVEAKGLSYTFKLYDSEGILVTQRTGRAYVPAGSRFPVFEGGLQTGSRVPTRTTFEFALGPDWKPGEAFTGIERLSVDVVEGAKPSATARVRNTTASLAFSGVDAFIVLYDSDDNRLAFSKTVIDSIGPGESKDLFYTWPEAFSKKVVRSELLFVPQK